MKIALLVASLGFAAAAIAAPITITNASFENLPLGGLNSSCAGTNCAYSSGQGVPGWVVSSGGGQFTPGNPANTIYFNSLPDGLTLGYLNSGTLSQTTAATVVLGVTYTLQVDVGVRKDCCVGIGLAFLNIGGTNIAATGSAPASGAFSTYTAVYTGVLADVGKSIGIVLGTPTSGQGDFDNVRLNDSTGAGVPEPASAALIGAGLAGLALLRRKR